MSSNSIKIKFSYSGDPSFSTRDAVRFHVGDTNPCEASLDDREIDYLLTIEPYPICASVKAALAIAAKYSRLADDSVGTSKAMLSQKSLNYRELAKELMIQCKEYKANNANIIGLPYAGGISESDKESNEADDDRVTPSFKRDTNDFPGNTPDSEGGS